MIKFVMTIQVDDRELSGLGVELTNDPDWDTVNVAAKALARAAVTSLEDEGCITHPKELEDAAQTPSAL